MKERTQLFVSSSSKNRWKFPFYRVARLWEIDEKIE
jgi:hypothetical protein